MVLKLSPALIVSLAANAALLGVVVGRWLSPAAPPEAAIEAQLDRYGPTTDVVDTAWAELPADDKLTLKRQLRESWIAMADERKYLSEAGKRVYAAALAEPFDEARLRDAVGIFQLRESRMQRSAEDILISHLRQMPAASRATAAVGLLTPFHGQVERAGENELASGELDGSDVFAPPPLKPEAKTQAN
jgi:Heavy-metal resistance